MRSFALLAALPLALAAPSQRASPAPLVKPHHTAQIIEGNYIVKLRDDANARTVDAHTSLVSKKPKHTYSAGKFHGFAAALTDDEVKALQDMPDVEYIEHDAVVKASVTTTQTSADWGLARLSNTAPGSTSYQYDSTGGQGACAYIVDTGVEVTHPEFEGRAVWASNQVDSTNTDGNGHGTHVAGTIGSKTYGVAKKVSIYAVKVLDASGSGTLSDVIAGMDFVVSDAPHRNCPAGVVVNLSLGGGYSASVNAAAANVVAAGHFMGVAAGNEAQDARNDSPASEPTVCTVGATDSTDTFAYYSNFGSLVNILAPGSSIKSTWIGGSTNVISGTSMATPHVVGIAAYYLGLGVSTTSGLCEFIAANAQLSAIRSVPRGTINAIINNGL